MIPLILALASRDADAACVIHGARPTVPLPTMVHGQEFSFIASPDCETLRFAIRDTTVSKIPKSGESAGPGPDTYKVRLTEGEWNDVVAASDGTITWVVTGRTDAGETTRLITTNDVKNNDGITIDASTADAVLVGDEHNRVGWDPVGAGDVNGDGNDDLLVSGVGDDEGGTDAGAVYLVLGPVTGTVEMSRADAKLLGERPEYYLGESSAGAGDVNGDGNDDLILGNRLYREGRSPGVAYVVLGPVSGTLDVAFADATLVGEDRFDEAGWSVAGAGDMNSDGNHDVLVGTGLRYDSSGPHGTAYLLHGPVTGRIDLGTADATLDLGEGVADGTRVTGKGDANGDGQVDLLIGSPYDIEAGDWTGAAYLLLGPAIGDMELDTAADAKLLAEADYDVPGHRLSWAGDVDGDGNDDMLIGALGNDEGGMYAGAAYLILSPVTGTHGLGTADAKLIGTEGEFVGATVAGPGDLDADGRDDLLIGAGGFRPDVLGAAYLMMSPVSGTIELASSADVTFLGDRRDDVLTGGVSGAGDVDADGVPDLVFGGVRHYDDGRRRAGAAYLFYGAGL